MAGLAFSWPRRVPSIKIGSWEVEVGALVLAVMAYWSLANA